MATTARGGRSLKEKMSAVGADPVQASIIKATDSEMRAPKQKHVDALLSYSFRHDVSMQEMCDGLMERAEHSSWIVVLKALTVFHRLMRDGHEKFSQYLVTLSSHFNLDSFLDKKSADGLIMSTFIQKYGKYLNSKIISYRQTGFDFCHVKASEKTQYLSKEVPPQLFASIKTLQGLMRSVLNTVSNDISVDASQQSSRGKFDVRMEVSTAQLLANEVVKSSVTLLFKDVLKLFVCLNEAIVNALGRYFTLPKSQAVEALALYETFTNICADIDIFIQACQGSGIMDGKNLPDLAQAPSALLPAMRDYIDNYGSRQKTEASSSMSASTPAELSQQTDRFASIRITPQSSPMAAGTPPAQYQQNISKGLSPRTVRVQQAAAPVENTSPEKKATTQAGESQYNPFL